ncbi:MAG: bifunctional metallophosphatase/5'-nucleotidase [bacterium]
MHGWRGWGLSLLMLGCGGGTTRPAEEEAPDAAFGAAAAGLDAAAACAVRKQAREATPAALAAAGIGAKAVEALLAHRRGPDGQPGTADDGGFDTLAELDAVPFVGPATLQRLQAGAPACGTVAVQVLGINDFHGNLLPPAGSGGRIQTGPDREKDAVEAGGVEYLATHLERLAATSEHTVIVAAGDLVGASPLISALFHDEPAIEALSLAGLDAAAVGNHEFDEGWTELLRLQRGGCHPKDGCRTEIPFAGADFQYLGANVIVEATGETLFPATFVRRFGGVRVGFIGLTLEGTPSVTVASGVKGLRFADEIETINAQAAALKAQGVETLVVLIHEGGKTTGLYNGCEGLSGPIIDIVAGLDPAVDVVLTGHSHQAYLCRLGGRIVASGAHAGRLVTDVDLTISEVTGDVVSMRAENVIVTRDVPKAPALTALIDRYQAVAAPLANRVIGRVEGDLTRALSPAGESTLGNVIADAQLAATRADGAVIAFMNPGGLRADIGAAQIAGGEAPGEVTYGEAFTAQPFNNLLVSMDLTGAQLDTLLEQQWSGDRARILSISQGFRYRYDDRRPLGDRVDGLTLDGKPVDPGPPTASRSTASWPMGATPSPSWARASAA